MEINKLDPCVYFPLVRTRAAELKGFQNLTDHVMDGIVPIFELTKSRRSKNNPIADVQIRIDEILNIMDGDPFFLDLTTAKLFRNEQIEDILFNYNDGFNKWRSFLENIPADKIIPVIQYHVDATREDFVQQIQDLENNYGNLAYRASLKNVSLIEIINLISNTIKEPSNFTLFLDSGFVINGTQSRIIKMYTNTINDLISKVGEINFRIVPLSSSFPSAVARRGYGNEHEGEFQLYEVDIHNNLTSTFPDLNIKYGDYSLIHPEPIGGGGGNWIPRIDVPLNYRCFYHRYKRENGGYINAANHVIEDIRYQDFTNEENWGCRQIDLAAKGDPEGKSPAHWISVRLNMHVTQQYFRLQSF